MHSVSLSAEHYRLTGHSAHLSTGDLALSHPRAAWGHGRPRARWGRLAALTTAPLGTLAAGRVFHTAGVGVPWTRAQEPAESSPVVRSRAPLAEGPASSRPGAVRPELGDPGEGPGRTRCSPGRPPKAPGRPPRRREGVKEGKRWRRETTGPGGGGEGGAAGTPVRKSTDRDRHRQMSFIAHLVTRNTNLGNFK